MPDDNKQIFRALGLMSGTSMDGIDAAIVESDGEGYVRTGASLTIPYSENFRFRLRATLGTTGETPMAQDVAAELTQLHAEATDRLRTLDGGRIDVVGFHGHTIFHDPSRRYTRQIGDGARLAVLSGVPVVNDFRAADVAAGGQGAPLVPLYHDALARELDRPLAVLNIGGVANVTFIGDGPPLAFDTGPGNALIDDLFHKRTGDSHDAGGATAARGTVDRAVLDNLLAHPYFMAPPPKSLDRDTFDAALLDALSLEDAAATLCAFTAESVALACAHLSATPRRWLVTGGGRHNKTLMAALAQALGMKVEPVEAVSWDGDALEAQAFAYLAVRSLRGLPLTLPTTTGVRSRCRAGFCTSRDFSIDAAVSARVLPASPAAIDEAAALLRAGQLVCFPTETVYGIGADARSDRAVAGIYAAKGRPSFNPLIVHVPDAAAAEGIALFDDRAEELATAFWPGPLTLVLPRRADAGISLLACAGLPSVAVRVPSHPVARRLLQAAGIPVAAPSANRSGRLSPTTPMHVAAEFDCEVAMILADGRTSVGLESTVLDLTEPQAVLLRPGGVTREEIEAVIGPVLAATEAGSHPKSPGMLEKHYAPSLPLRMNAAVAREGEGYLAFGPDAFGGRGAARMLNLSEAGDLTEAAANLFAMLHQLDDPALCGIAVAPVPETGLGAAINDRLKRASKNN